MPAPVRRGAGRLIGAAHHAAGAREGRAGLARQAELADSPALSPSPPASELPSVAAPCWLDLRGYDAPAAAAALAKPVLVVQGGRDYQATLDDDLPRWHAALAERPDLTIRVDPADDHFFLAGRTPRRRTPCRPVSTCIRL